jgi:hypothetical protein
MKIESGKRNDFFGYLTPLRLLEQAFRAANIKIDCTLHFDKFKWVEIKKNYTSKGLIALSTPEQLIRDAARFLGERPPKKEKKHG